MELKCETGKPDKILLNTKLFVEHVINYQKSKLLIINESLSEKVAPNCLVWRKIINEILMTFYLLKHKLIYL